MLVKLTSNFKAPERQMIFWGKTDIFWEKNDIFGEKTYFFFPILHNFNIITNIVF